MKPFLLKRATSGISTRADGQPHYRDDGVLVVPGILATDAWVREYVPGEGFALVQLRIDQDIVESWKAEGRDSLPYLLDHGDEGDWMQFGNRVSTRIGRVENIRADGGFLRGDFLVDPDLAIDDKGRNLTKPIERGTLDSNSIGFRVDELVLIEKKDGELAKFRAVQWTPLEESNVWAGADPGARLHRSQGMDPEQVQAMITDAVSKAVTEVVRTLKPQKAEEPPVSEAPALPTTIEPLAERQSETATFDAATDAAIELVGPERAAELIRDAGGNAITLGSLVRCERAKKPAPTVPTNAPITGGNANSERALADMSLFLLARGLSFDAKLATEAQSRFSDWRSMTVHQGVREYMQARYPQERQPLTPYQLIERVFQLDRESGPGTMELHDGHRWVRDADGGLTPGNLPSVFQDVANKAMRRAHDFHVLPLDQLAMRRDTDDFRTHHDITTELYAEWQELGANAPLLPVEFGDAEGTYKAGVYGHTATITIQAMVDDDLGLIVMMPGKMGAWTAAMKSKQLQTTITDATYSLNYDKKVADPSATLAADLEAIRALSLADTVIAKGAHIAAQREAAKTISLQPTAMLYGTTIYKPWYERNREVSGVFDTRAETVRTPFEMQLFQNSHQGLYVTATHYHVWPGPEQGTCPLQWGEVRGLPMRIQVQATGGSEQDGLRVRSQSSFYVAEVYGNRIYRVSPS